MTKQEFIEKLISKNRYDIELIGDYINTATKTLFKCTKQDCLYEWYATPNKILSQGHGCPVCAGKEVSKNINSIWALRPDLLQYFVDIEEAYCYTVNSHKVVHLKCPNCGSFKNMTVYSLSTYGFCCQTCRTNISYPNRLIRSILNQFKDSLDYLEYEWSSDWSERLRYDVYFEKDKQKYIIEMQGSQHYMGGWKNKKTLEEIQDIDMKKKNLAIQHNIIPIIIDARNSEFNFIFNNIKDSILNQIFDFNKIDISKCQEEIISSNNIKIICEAYQQNASKSIKKLSNDFQLSQTTIRKYLKIGTQLGWCEYIPEEIGKTKIRVLDANKNIIGEYLSIADCIRDLTQKYKTTFISGNISRACKKRYTCRGLYFEYI